MKTFAVTLSTGAGLHIVRVVPVSGSTPAVAVKRVVAASAPTMKIGDRVVIDVERLS